MSYPETTSAMIDQAIHVLEIPREHQTDKNVDVSVALTWLRKAFAVESDRDRLADILRQIDAECDRFDGITPLYSRWVAIKKLAKEGATHPKATP